MAAKHRGENLIDAVCEHSVLPGLSPHAQGYMDRVCIVISDPRQVCSSHKLELLEQHRELLFQLTLRRSVLFTDKADVLNYDLLRRTGQFGLGEIQMNTSQCVIWGFINT